ncbi:MAG: hypothetical protein GX856_03325 [Gammaproteobacteria bacterium]|nr:hypothetical protein [Gammaproteobacteria bacterium]
MHAILDNLPLPAAAPGRARRHRIAGRDPDPRSVDRFQSVARALAARGEVPALDGIASAARCLTQRYAGHARVPCIRQRSRCLQALRMLVRDPGWSLSPEQVERIALIADYARGDHRLVPDAMPLVGGLDTAVLVDIAWPSLSADAEAYLDYRRLRLEEARLRGERPGLFDFDREAWLAARSAEIALRAHVAMRGAQSYLPGAAAPLFRVQ